MLVTLPELLSCAKRGNFAVVAPVFTDLFSVSVMLEAAQEAGAPLILSFHPSLMPCAEVPSYRRFIRLVREEIERSSVPVCLHLDHGRELDEVREALDLGFTSVMFDGSSLPLEQNIALTRQAVLAAHAVGAGAEGEIGRVPGLERQGEAGPALQVPELTDPAVVPRFVNETQVDALAVSIGNVHGPTKGRVRIDFQRVQEISRRVPVPLVLHGASGTARAVMRRLIACNVRKVNVFSDFSAEVRKELLRALRQRSGGTWQHARARREAIRRVVLYYLDLTGSVGRGVLPPGHAAGDKGVNCAPE